MKRWLAVALFVVACGTSLYAASHVHHGHHHRVHHAKRHHSHRGA